VRNPAAADVRDRSVRELAGGIELRPGGLSIQFYGVEDLAAKLFELSQAMAGDRTRSRGLAFGSRGGAITRGFVHG